MHVDYTPEQPDLRDPADAREANEVATHTSRSLHS